jgi:hypothetical protein
MRELRRPGQIPVTDGLDTDGDGRADTVVGVDTGDLVLASDLDGDGLADQVLRIGADGVVRHTELDPSGGDLGGSVLDGMTAGVEFGCQ